MARIDPSEDERRAFKRTLEPLLAADGRKFDLVEWTAYFEALRDIPLPLLAQAVVLMSRERRQFPFRAGDVRDASERARQALIAAHPHVPCIECRDAHGWVERVDDHGHTRLARCACFTEHQARLTSMGVPSRPLVQLPAAAEQEQFV